MQDIPRIARKVVVVGQGYVGLPVAIRAAEVGYDVTGIEIDKHRVDRLRSGSSYVEDVGNDRLQQALASGKYVPSDDYDAAAGFSVAVITVPTPLHDAAPDLRFIELAATELGERMPSGATVILESTTYPGTTEEVLAPLLEQVTGLRCGIDFYVGYSPERIDPGNKTWNLVNTPKVVSGLGEEALARANEFYSRLVSRVVLVSGTKEAELTKLLENTFRHVNIALMNEVLVFANELQVNVWESIDAAATKPFGFMQFLPGPGVGGHCLPVDPSYLSWQVRRRLGRTFRFVELANDVNDHMPDYVVSRVIAALNRRQLPVNGSAILLIGLAYKKNTGDIRESPSLRIISLLEEYGARLSAADRHIEQHHWPVQVRRVELTRDVVLENDLILLLADHDDFDYAVLDEVLDRVFDTRGRVKGAENVL
jgi:UDP-N-acetyl-D-glucosamine dehydrogenase